MSEFTLDYTGEQINEKLQQVDVNEENIINLSKSIEDLESVQYVEFTSNDIEKMFEQF